MVEIILLQSGEDLSSFAPSHMSEDDFTKDQLDSDKGNDSSSNSLSGMFLSLVCLHTSWAIVRPGFHLEIEHRERSCVMCTCTCRHVHSLIILRP